LVHATPAVEPTISSGRTAQPRLARNLFTRLMQRYKADSDRLQFPSSSKPVHFTIVILLVFIVRKYYMLWPKWSLGRSGLTKTISEPLGLLLGTIYIVLTRRPGPRPGRIFLLITLRYSSSRSRRFYTGPPRSLRDANRRLRGRSSGRVRAALVLAGGAFAP
jgi:hypothetical protein